MAMFPIGKDNEALTTGEALEILQTGDADTDVRNALIKVANYLDSVKLDSTASAGQQARVDIMRTTMRLAAGPEAIEDGMDAAIQAAAHVQALAIITLAHGMPTEMRNVLVDVTAENFGEALKHHIELLEKGKVTV